MGEWTKDLYERRKIILSRLKEMREDGIGIFLRDKYKILNLYHIQKSMAEQLVR